MLHGRRHLLCRRNTTVIILGEAKGKHSCHTPSFPLYKNMMLGEGVEREKLGSKVDRKAPKISSQLQTKIIVELVSILKQLKFPSFVQGFLSQSILVVQVRVLKV